MDKKCGTCALFIPQNSGCTRTKTIESPEGCCNHWLEELPICEVCGRPFVPPINYLACENGYKIICNICASKRGTCEGCGSSKYCDFKQNPIAIPPTMQKTIRQGNMVASVTVVNIERIKATCIASGCKCYHKDDDNEWCCRQFGTCGNYNND